MHFAILGPKSCMHEKYASNKVLIRCTVHLSIVGMGGVTSNISISKFNEKSDYTAIVYTCWGEKVCSFWTSLLSFFAKWLHPIPCVLMSATPSMLMRRGGPGVDTIVQWMIIVFRSICDGRWFRIALKHTLDIFWWNFIQNKVCSTLLILLKGWLGCQKLLKLFYIIPQCKHEFMVSITNFKYSTSKQSFWM